MMYISNGSDNYLIPLRLARANALDILAAQPEGPYLLGGHSYGGAVAAEVLEGNGMNGCGECQDK